jgi:uncharacterized coiled-coil protein SlyX
MTDKNSIIDQILSENEETTQNSEKSEPTAGKYKTSKKFLNFIQGLKGNIRIFQKTAFLDGKSVSGMLEEVTFKVTICDDGALDIEELNTSQTDEPMLQRIADEISEKEVIGYMKKYILSGTNFHDENDKPMYIEVEEKKPIQKLFDLFEEEEKVVSETALSIIDFLFDDDDLKTENAESIVPVEEVVKEPTQLSIAQQMIMDSFNEMNREKIQELEDRIEKKEKELRNLESTFNSTQKSIETGKVDLRVLRTRLDDMKPLCDPNGVVFYVSSENKTGIEVDENLKLVVNKVSEALKLKKDVVLDMVTQGYYTIKICGKDNLNDAEYQVSKDSFNELMKLNSFGKISMVSANEFEFRGDLNWHQLVDKMIKWGFEQDPEWDKICNSPSYQSEFEKEDETDENILSEHKEEESEMKSVLYRTYNQPETLVVLDITTIEDAPRGVEITDDESCFSLYIGNKFIKDYGCLGFVNILTMKEYNEFVKQCGSQFHCASSGEIDCGLEGFVIPNFTGNIEFVAKNSETGRFTDEFDFSDYIQHQLNNDGDYFDVGIKLPEGTIVFDLNEDLTLPVEYLRDQKIEDIIK